MRITTRLVLSFLVLSIFPLVVVSYIGGQVLGEISMLALGESTQALKQLGEASIHQKALDVARQVELYLDAHPELLTLSADELEADEALAAIAVQPVGETGYTAVYDDKGITHFHVNLDLVGADLHELADDLPAFWAILGTSLDGTMVADYYEWRDADGSIRDKYMSCVPVGDTRLRVAATTYIDEFYQPIRDTEAKITALSRTTKLHLRIVVCAVGVMAILVAVLVAAIVTRPLKGIAEGARLFSQGKLDHDISVGSRDEIGQLAVTFNHMARELAKTLQEKDDVARQLHDFNRDLEQMVAERTAELAEEKSKLDVIFENVADGLVVTDTGGHVVFANPVFEAIVGRPAFALGGRLLNEVLSDEGLEIVVTNALLEVGRVFSADVQVGQRMYKASACALQPDGDASGVVTVLRDVTHEKEVDRMKTDFISMVSHELRTPLTSVLGFAKLIGRSFAKDLVPRIPAGDRRGQRAVQRISGNLDIIVGEGERLTRLINDVLDIAKMEAGKMVWHFENVGVEDVIRRAIAATSSLVDAEDVAVEVEVEEGLPSVWADRDRLVQVVTNLLSNAIKFTDEGWIRVRGHRLWVADGQWQGEAGLNLPAFQPASLPLPQSTTPTDWLMVSVQDTGIGIAEEHLPEIFEKFRQVGDVLTDRPKGTGLGLSICKEIVDHHGGRIWAESELGRGSTFTFVLPLTAEVKPRPPVMGEIRRRVVEALRSDSGQALRPGLEQARLEQTRSEQARLEQVRSALPGGRDGRLILVVDDDASIRKLLYQELTEVGYRVIEAADGAEALSKAREEQPALIVLDVMMPGISGFDVTSVLKADPVTANIPILILSILEDQEKGFRLGADEYLTKPLAADELLEGIATLLARAERGEGRKKVLIIDQDASLIETIARVLQEQGYRVVKAYDGQEGLEKARQERPDIVILDAMISEMNDYEVLRALKYETEVPNVRIIVLVAEPSPQEIAKMLNRGGGQGGEGGALPGLLIGGWRLDIRY